MFVRRSILIIAVGMVRALAGCAGGDKQNSTCGDGAINGSDQCDGKLLNNASCMSLGFTSGTLKCSDTCTYDTSACVDASANCGNGAIDGNEDCDVGNLNGEDCVSQGFDGGDLACGSNCKFDTTACVAPGCGNGYIDDGEDCEQGIPFDSVSCTYLGYSGGDLACVDCSIDPSGCTLDCTEDSYEPNSTSATAKPITTLPFTDSGLVMCGPDDQDWYSVAIPAGTIFQFDLAFTNSSGDLDIGLFDPADLEFPVAYSEQEGSDTESIVYANTGNATVTYLLEVVRYDHPVVSQTYFLAIASLGAVECDPEAATDTCGAKVCKAYKCVDRPQGDTCATPIVVASLPYSLTGVNLGAFNPDFAYSATTCTGYETDGPDAFYQVTLASGDHLRVVVTPNADLDPAVYVIATACDQAAACLGGMDGGDNGAVETLDYTAASAGNVLVVVDSWTAAATGTYDISITKL